MIGNDGEQSGVGSCRHYGRNLTVPLGVVLLADRLLHDNLLRSQEALHRFQRPHLLRFAFLMRLTFVCKQTAPGTFS
jgi:hypothetical protein